MEKTKKRFVIIDGKSVFYRGYYAMPNLRTLSGTPTGGVYGFGVMSLEVIKRLKPDYVAVAWDKPKTNIRKRLEIYPEYKAGRKPAPADFYEQIPILHKFLDALGWPLYELDDYEADDIIGALAVQASKQDIETLIVTSDLDMLQVLHDDIKVYALKSGLSNIELFSPATFEAKHHIKVSQYLDLKSLKGDSSDNIPGVPGIGEKTAVELLNEYKTLDGIYENIELIKDSVKKKLIEGKDLALISKQLAKIYTDAPIKLNLNEVDGSKIKVSELMEILEELQFHSLKNKVADLFPSFKEVHEQVPKAKIKIVHIQDSEQLKGIKLKEEPTFIYTRAAGKNGTHPKVLLIGQDSEAYSLEIDKFSTSEILDFIKNLDNLVGYDLKNSFKVLIELGLSELPQVQHDVMIGPFLINSLIQERSLADMCNLGFLPEDLDDQELLMRGGEIISGIKQLYEMQVSELDKLPKVLKLAKDIEWPLIAVLARMEKTGIRLDEKYLSKFSVVIDSNIKKLEQEIFSLTKHEFNIASPMQLSDVLFSEDKLSLPKQGIKKNKNGYSTAANELEKLRDLHPVINLILDYREVTKLKNTYVDTLPKQIDEDGRVHTNYSVTTAQTGRLSSLDPNLQNIPIRTELGRNIRTAFVADKGMTLVSADYSQFELRLAAVLAKDEELIETYNNGADIHLMTAANVYGRSPEDVTKQMRDAAKTINFGILYGMSPHGLSVATKMTREQAQEFIHKYKELRAPLFKYMDEVIEETKAEGYCESMFGRRRYFPDINSRNFILRQAAERAAINMPIQGTEADLMKMAMIKCDKALRDLHNDCKILLQIHDSIIVECPKAVAKQVAKVVQEQMESVYKLPLRLDVEVKTADNWGDL